MNELVKACEEEFGVSAAAGVVVAAASAGAAEAAEEKDEFDVELTEVGPNKVCLLYTSCWGKMRAWGCHMVHHAIYFLSLIHI